MSLFDRNSNFNHDPKAQPNLKHGRGSGKLDPSDIRALVSRVQHEDRDNAPAPSISITPSHAQARLTPDDLLDQYFDNELDEVGKAALQGHLQRDPGLRACCSQTREALKLLRAMPIVADRTEAILAEVDQRRRFLLRSTRVKVWGLRAALAAALALAAGAAITLDRDYPGLLHESSPAPIGDLETAGRSDARATVASAMDVTKEVVSAVAQPLFSDRPIAASSFPRAKGSPKLALGSQDTGPRLTWRATTSSEIPSTSGSARSLAAIGHSDSRASSYPLNIRLVAATIPDVRVLRCDWEPDSTLRARDVESGTNNPSNQNSWWLRAWMQSSSGYTPAASSYQR